MQKAKKLFEQNPIIGAIRGTDAIDDIEGTDIKIVFLLGGTTLYGLKDVVERVKKIDRMVFIHIDLIEGLAKDESAVEYLAKEIKVDGIITTRTNLIKHAKKQGILTVQRLFLVDSASISSGIKLVNSVRPDYVEIMPGIIPRVTKALSEKLNEPIIAGGMITTKEDIINALNHGACAVSTSKPELWRV